MLQTNNPSFVRFLHHLMLSLAATLLSVSGYLSVQGSLPSMGVALATFSLTFFAYRLSARKPVFRLNGQGFYFEEHLPKAELIVGLVLVVYSFLVAGTAVKLLLPFTGLLTLFYFLRWRIGNNEFAGLRGIPLVKNVVLAVSWAIITVCFPASGHIGEALWANLFLHRFLLILILGLGVDMRDMVSDQHSGLRTLPLILGFQKVKVISILLCLAAMWFVHSTQPLLTIGRLGVWGLIILSLLLLKEGDRPSKFTWLLDGSLLLSGIVELILLLK